MSFAKSVLLATLAFTSSIWAGELRYSVVPNFFDSNPGGKPIGPSAELGVAVRHESKPNKQTHRKQGPAASFF